MEKGYQVHHFCYHYCVAVVTALLLISETRGQLSPDYSIQARLLSMYEEALVNSNDSLYTLKRMYFASSPKSKYSSSFCLEVCVDIDNPPPLNQWPWSAVGDAAFVDGYFSSKYILHLLSDDGDTSRLGDLLTSSTSGLVFYMADPTFYTTMHTLAKSIDTDEYGFLYPDNSRVNSIKIHIRGTLEYMPYRDDAVDAMKMLLVWVSVYYI